MGNYGTETTSMALRYGMVALMGSPAIMGGASWETVGHCGMLWDIMGYYGVSGVNGVGRVNGVNGENGVSGVNEHQWGQ